MKGDCFIQSYFAKTILLFALCFCEHAHAQLYLGAGYGVTEPVDYVSQVETNLPETEGDVGYRVFIGNSVSERFAAEISYLDFGTYDVGTIDGEPDPLVFEDTLEITGIDFSVIGKWNLTKYFRVFAKGGLFYWNGERYVHELKANEAGDLVEQETSLSYDDLSTSMGAGFEYRILRHIGIQLEASLYGTESIAQSFYGLSVYYTF